MEHSQLCYCTSLGNQKKLKHDKWNTVSYATARVSVTRLTNRWSLWWLARDFSTQCGARILDEGPNFFFWSDPDLSRDVSEEGDYRGTAETTVLSRHQIVVIKFTTLREVYESLSMTHHW